MNKPTELYIGLMSGTSIDGIDVALVEFIEERCELLQVYNHSIDARIKQKLVEISSPVSDFEIRTPKRIELLAELDVIMGHYFADAVNQLIELHQIKAENIVAIGSHGQTIRHRPNNQSPFTMQIGDANIIAEKTNIQTVADFRRADIAAGGQGAPLAPAFHNSILRSPLENRIILNLGGIANITYLPQNNSEPVIGFDTGTANTLLDAWYITHHSDANEEFDRDSQLAQQGQVHQELLNKLLEDPFFQLSPPKSTGREYFSLNWLKKRIDKLQNPITVNDVQRTLLEFSVKTIADSIKKIAIDNFKIFACGGGMHNRFLLERLSKELKQPVKTTKDIGIDGDYLEAMTFAWLAKQRLEQLPGNLASVTGASRNKVLGCVYLP